jgi:hypothetical protein
MNRSSILPNLSKSKATVTPKPVHSLSTPSELRKIEIPGIGFLAIKTEKHDQLFIPSQKNYFGCTPTFPGLQFDKVKIADGVDDVLLFIPPAEEFPNFLENLVDIYPKASFSLKLMKGISSKFPVLEIEGGFGGPFTVKLCTDIIPENKSRNIKMSRSLSFALCGEDIQVILESSDLESFRRNLTLSCLDNARSWRKNGFNSPRRRYVLLGQSVINSKEFVVGNHESGPLRIFFTSDFNFELTVRQLQTICWQLYGQLTNAGVQEYEQFLEELEELRNEDCCEWVSIVGI